ncbi:MAG: class II fructose-bisphosphate aldolase [Candidatus Nealsonbacteria bacterium]
MNLRQYFKKAEKEGWAIGQFNISNLETLRAIVLAGLKLKSPVLIGTSEGESKFLGLDVAVSLVSAFRKETGHPIFLNLDHGRSLDYIRKAMEAGYDAVHFDGSKLPLKKNIKIAKQIVSLAKKKGVWVEGEVGFISGSSTVLKDSPELREQDLTDPKEANTFVKETGVDILAVNIGTFHGIKAFGKNPRINMQRLKEIRKFVGNIPLVMHGGSGTPEIDIKTALKFGIRKININTELRLAFSKGLLKSLSGGEIVPYKCMPEVILGVQKVVEEKIKLFGSVNKI